MIILSHFTVAQKISPELSSIAARSIVPNQVNSGPVKILAIMVQFMPDNDRTTVGNGQFDSIYTRDWGMKILDPMPHDTGYFSAHLRFAKNYYSKISDGALDIQYTVIPQIITLSKTMRDYSPPIRSTDFSGMVTFYEEAWQQADLLNPGFNFADYNLFCVFHAGVGRDVSLPGSLNNERDLPSVYLNIPTFQRYKGEIYLGVPVSNGAFKIPNSMILPQTQNREIESFGGQYLIELTINGLLVSSIASHLGLPDLFDTQTGLSAIGRFGLMDGQSIFAYNGVFPPQPSAWEKIKLGWITPVELNSSMNLSGVTHFLNAASVASQTDTTVFKIGISSDEYYLVENRIKDAANDGLWLTIWNNGNESQKYFEKDTSWFNSYTVDSLEGVIVDADDFDWALPGSGILIWHIDDKVIREKLANNAINTDKLRRGVDLEEADGIQDIGEQFTTIFGDVLVGEGDLLDLWYNGNEADLYLNEFSGSTRPSTISNDGANSLIKFTDFSTIQNRASFKLSSGNNIVHLSRSENNYSTSLKNIEYFAINNSNYRIEEFDSLTRITYTATIDIPKYSKNAIYSIEDSVLIMIDVSDSSIIQNVLSGNSHSVNYFSAGEKITAGPVRSGLDFYIGLNNGLIKKYRITKEGNIQNIEQVIVDPGNQIVKLYSVSNFVLSVSHDGIKYNLYQGDLRLMSSDYEVVNILSALYRDNSMDLHVATSDGEIIIYSKSSTTPFVEKYSFNTLSTNSPSYTLNNENTEVQTIYTSGRWLRIVNDLNIPVDNFPIEFSGTIASNIVSAQTSNQNASPVIFFATSNGLLNGISSVTGKTIDGFPLPFNPESNSKLFLRNNLNNNTSLIAHSSTGYLYEWELTDIAHAIIWADKDALTGYRSAFSLYNKTVNTSSLLVESKTYNYPNPVYEGKTSIRFFVNQNSNISVRIFDLAGDLAAEINTFAIAGYDSEVEWDVTSVQSGVYFARVEAKGTNGITEQKIIKIAVVK